jgi:ABC-2 type transport system permease protein
VLPLYWLVFGEHLRWEGYNLGPAFLAAVVAGHVLSFCLSYMFGLLALFFTEVRGIYMVYYMPASFLSGELVPLSTLPAWAEVAARLLPFRYSLAFPVEILLNRLPPEEIAWGFLCLAAWLMLAWVGVRVLWAAGLKQYTGVGM